MFDVLSQRAFEQATAAAARARQTTLQIHVGDGTLHPKLHNRFFVSFLACSGARGRFLIGCDAAAY
jgi:hypothetical protein